MNQHLPMIDLAREMAETPAAASSSRAATTPAGSPPPARRGMDHDWSAGPWKHPAAKYEGSYLARKGMAWLCAFTAWVLFSSLFAFLAGGGLHKAAGNIAHDIEAARLAP